MVVKFGDGASSSRSRVSLFNQGVISLAEMESNGGEGFGALWLSYSPAGGVSLFYQSG